MQTDLVLQRVQADDEIWAEYRVRRASGRLRHHGLVLGDLAVEDVDDFDRAVAEDLLAVSQAPRRPAVEDVVRAGALGGVDDGVFLAVACADEEDDTAAAGDFADDFRRALQVGVGGVEADDVDAVADAEDVGAIARVPERGVVAEVGLCGEEHREGDLEGGGWIPEVGEGGVGGRGVCADVEFFAAASAEEGELRKAFGFDGWEGFGVVGRELCLFCGCSGRGVWIKVSQRE